MFALLYALAIGPENWPITILHTYVVLYELLAETTVLWGLVVYGVMTAHPRKV